LLQFANALDSIHARQINVHQNDIGLVFGQADQSIFGVGVLADATETFGAIQQAGQRAPQLVVIFHEGNGNRHNI
jgi:hypothetical protein